MSLCRDSKIGVLPVEGTDDWGVYLVPAPRGDSMITRNIITALAAASVVALAATGCGSSGPAWCGPASKLQLAKGEPKGVSIDVTIGQSAASGFVGSDSWLQQGAAARVGSPALNDLVARMKQAGCKT